MNYDINDAVFNSIISLSDSAFSTLIFIHPSKKVTQHDFDRFFFFFYPGSLFLKFDIPRG